jgi:hypothetical protein
MAGYAHGAPFHEDSAAVKDSEGSGAAPSLTMVTRTARAAGGPTLAAVATAATRTAGSSTRRT